MRSRLELESQVLPVLKLYDFVARNELVLEHIIQLSCMIGPNQCAVRKRRIERFLNSFGDLASNFDRLFQKFFWYKASASSALTSNLSNHQFVAVNTHYAPVHSHFVSLSLNALLDRFNVIELTIRNQKYSLLTGSLQTSSDV